MAQQDHRPGASYSLPQDLGAVRGVHRQPRLAGGAVVTENGVLTTQDFVPGSTGWILRGDGTFELDGGIFRGDLESDNYVAGTSGWQLTQVGGFEANDGTFRGTLTAADISGGNVVVQNTGLMKSSNYSAGSAGWQIEGDGDAEFNDVTVRGDIFVDTLTTVGGTGYVTMDAGGAGEIFFRYSGDSSPGYIYAGSANDLAIIAPVGDIQVNADADISILGGNDILVSATGDLNLQGTVSTVITNPGGFYDSGAWQTPTLTNSWVDFGSGREVRYRIKGRSVEVTGTAKNGVVGAGTPIFTLPSGYRPSRTCDFSVTRLDTNNNARVTVDSSGAVTASTGSSVGMTLALLIPLD